MALTRAAAAKRQPHSHGRGGTLVLRSGAYFIHSFASARACSDPRVCMSRLPGRDESLRVEGDEEARRKPPTIVVDTGKIEEDIEAQASRRKEDLLQLSRVPNGAHSLTHSHHRRSSLASPNCVLIEYEVLRTKQLWQCARTVGRVAPPETKNEKKNAVFILRKSQVELNSMHIEFPS